MSRSSNFVRNLGFSAGVLRAKPFHLQLQVTNRCNMRCSFCDFWRHGVSESKEMTLDDFGWLEKELSQMGRFLLVVEGGEPLLRKDILDIVEIFSRRHITNLYTNGWHVNVKTASELFNRGLSLAGVSIDFPDADRHDRIRGLEGAFERAWHAVDMLRDAAPDGDRQVEVMTVYMDDNAGDIEALLRQSAAHGVGHDLTLISTKGCRRADGAAPPAASAAESLMALWHKYSHFRVLRYYIERMNRYLAGEKLPACKAGAQSFNIDHLGNVAACIETIDRPAGNVREEPLCRIHARLANLDWVSDCQDCWTVCRGFNIALASGGRIRGWRDLVTRMRKI